MSLVWLINGVVDKRSPIPVGAPPHQRVDHGGLSMLLSEQSGPVEIDAVMNHTRLLTAYADARGVVPARFGGAVSDLAAAEEALRAGAESYRRLLDDLADAAEFALKISMPTPPDSPPIEEASSGRAYLRQKSSERSLKILRSESRRKVLSEIADRLKEVARDASARPSTARGENREIQIDIAFLVPHSLRAEFIERAKDLHPVCAHEGLEMDLTGPWPPVSFAISADTHTQETS